MPLRKQSADLGNLGEEFLDRDPQQGDVDPITRTPDRALGRMDEDSSSTDLGASDDEDDTVLNRFNEDPGPLDTEFMIPAPSQEMYADEEPGGMFGSTADELLGSPGPDGTDLGDTSGDVGLVRGAMGEAGLDGLPVEIRSSSNVRGSSGLEDELSTDLPIGGTYGDGEPIVDPATGELTDYDEPDGST